MGGGFKDWILYDMGESAKSQVKFTVIGCANSLVFEYEEGVDKTTNYLACYLVVKQWLLLETKLQMEGQVKEDVDDDMFSKTSSNFSGMTAHTWVWSFTLHFLPL